MNERQERLQEQFDRDVDILRGAGGFVTTDDLRAHGEAMRWAAVSESCTEATFYDEAELLTMKIEDHEQQVAAFFADRHNDPESREWARKAVGFLRADREKLAKLDK